MIHEVSNFATAAASAKPRRTPESAKVSPAQAIHRRGRTNQRVTPTAHAGRAQRPAAHRRLRQERSPPGRSASGAAWGCRTSCRTRLQSFAPGADRSARPTVLREAIEAPALSRSPRTNAPFRSPFGSASNAVQEEIERSLDLERDLTAQATSPECRHSRLLARYERPEVDASSDSEQRRSQKALSKPAAPRGARGKRPTQPQQTLQRPARRGSRRTGRRRRVRVSRCRSSDRRQRRR
jgi:hypothetical protein